MRLQARFEISEGAGDLIARYNREQRNPSSVLQALDREQSDMWLRKNAEAQADAWLIRTSAYTQAATADLMRLRSIDLIKMTSTW